MADNNKYFIIDFDSTFTKVEALDVLAEISLQNHPDKNKRIEEIKNVTNDCMNGQGSFRDTLVRRIELLEAHKDHIPQVVEKLKQQVSASIQRNKEFFDRFSPQILIISSGFKEIIEPIVKDYNIKEENIYANTFRYDDEGNVIGFDEENVLSTDNGKVELLKSLSLKGDVYVIGDGYTDYEIKEAGLANKFYAFTENVKRDKVMEKADHVAPSLDEFLYQNKLPASVSYPKNRIKVLLLENVHPAGVALLEEEGYDVETVKGGLDEDELSEKIKDIHILGIRSKTQVTEKVLQNANKLMVVGAFCIGTNQIDLDACTKRGIAVFNAPYSNTRSVVEMAIGEIVMLARKIPMRSSKMHEGVWDKSAKGSLEIRGKKLGIVGYGNIGKQLSVLAESMGMDVYYYDVQEKLSMGNATKCNSLDELLNIADFTTLHVDGRSENKNMIGKRELKAMKKGSYLLNLSRGSIIDVPALAEQLKEGHLAGAAIDVYPKEPKSNDEEFVSELRGLDNVILTPHIGGSTEEAQYNIGNFVPNQIINYINTGSTDTSVNFPNLQLPEFPDAHRLLHIHENKPGIIAEINQILAKHEVNILGQHLKTNELIGYVITDVNKEYNEELIQDFKKIDNTIKFRVLY